MTMTTDICKFLQSTELSYSCYKMTATTRKALYVLCSRVNTVNNEYTSTIYFPDLCRRLGIALTTTREKRNLLKGLKELRKSYVTFGKPEALFDEHFKWVNWFQELDYDPKTRILSVVWSNRIGEMITNQKKSFSEIDIETVLSFKSFYALRLYELCLSKSGFAGKSGNFQNMWFLQLSEQEITDYIFGSDYSFSEKIRLLKKAVAEVNEKAGFKCELMPPSSGKRYNRSELFIFSCEKNIEKAIEKKQKKAAATAQKAIERIDPIEKMFDNAVRIPAVYQYYSELLEKKDPLTFECTLKKQALEKFGFL